MELLDLLLFSKVCAEGSISRAATGIGMAQAAVSVRMRGLEVELGQTLFERSRRGVKLTAAGESFLPYAERCLAVLNEGRQAIRTPEPAALRVAMVSGLAQVVAPAVARFWQQHETPVSIITGNSHDALAWLMDGTADVAVAVAMPVPAGLRSMPLQQAKVAIVAAAAHPLAQRYSHQPLPLDDLRSARLALNRKTAGAAGLIERLEERNRAPLSHMLEGPAEICRHLVLNAGAVSLIPLLYVADDLTSGRMVALEVQDFAFPTIDLMGVYRDRKRAHAGAQEFLRLLTSR